MYPTTQGFNPLHTIFGSGYVLEQHADETHHSFPLSESVMNIDGMTRALRGAMFDEVMKSLRAALSIR